MRFPPGYYSKRNTIALTAIVAGFATVIGGDIGLIIGFPAHRVSRQIGREMMQKESELRREEANYGENNVTAETRGQLEELSMMQTMVLESRDYREEDQRISHYSYLATSGVGVGLLGAFVRKRTRNL